MKLRLFICLLVLLSVSAVCQARGYEFAAGVDFSTNVSNNIRFDHYLRQVGVQGEFRLKLVQRLWLNSILTVNYYQYNYDDILAGAIITEENNGLRNKNRRGVAFHLNEYFNMRLPKGFGIGTGPAVYKLTDDWDYSAYRWYWVFGVEKTFINKLTTRLTWQQKLQRDMCWVRNQLNLSITYTF